MQHTEEHAAEAPKSIQTNGSGLLLLTIVSVLLAIFCWNMWKDGDKEAQHYRFEKAKTSEGAVHEEAHH
jgi:hypothetical protein